MTFLPRLLRRSEPQAVEPEKDLSREALVRRRIDKLSANTPKRVTERRKAVHDVLAKGE